MATYTISPCTERSAKRLTKQLAKQGATVTATQEPSGFWTLTVTPGGTILRVGR